MPRPSSDEAWRLLVDSHIDPACSVNRITAEQIKSLGVEPRLMTKYDARSSRPQILKENGLFLLPETNGSYWVLKEDGYCDLNMTGASHPQEHTANFPFPFETLENTGSEMSHLDRLYLAGLIQKFVGSDSLWATVRGRRFSPKFQYQVGTIGPLDARGIQYEVDQGYEGTDEIVLFEAKGTTPQDFLIRQLYFPYRVFTSLCRKHVRCVFLNFNSATNVYSFLEYRFSDPQQYKSIELVKSAHYILRTPDAQTKTALERLLEDARQLPLPDTDWELPQANDFGKVAAFPLHVAEGYDDSASMATVFDFDPRQSSYYRKACEQVGLVTTNKEGRYVLTDRGKDYLTLTQEERIQYLIKAVLSLPIFRATFEAALARKDHRITQADIERLAAVHSHITGDTLRRRAHSVFSWLRWLESVTGELKIGGITLTIQ